MENKSEDTVLKQFFLKHQRKIEIVIGLTVGVVMLVSWTKIASYENGFLNYGRAADSSMGRIVPYEVKGIIFYISQSEYNGVTLAHHFFSGAFYAAALLGGIFYFLKMKWDREPNGL